jgi:hypothetical protein
MKQVLIIFLIGISSIRTFSQENIASEFNSGILKTKGELVTDTLDNKSLYIIKRDTLTRLLIEKSSSTDRCSSFSIIRELYKKEKNGFKRVKARRISIGSKCTSLWSNNVYCLRLIKFKFKNGKVHIIITDSNVKKLKTRLRCDNNFEIQLKTQLDKFINNIECNGVQVE